MSRKNVIRTDLSSTRLKLLSPTVTLPRKRLINLYQTCPSEEALDNLLTHWQASDYVAIDFETVGTDASDTNCYPVGMALAWDTGIIYVNFPDKKIPPELEKRVLQLDNLVAHNALFDFQWFSQWKKPMYCTYTLYRQLASEGYPDQTWGLKGAMTSLLGWEDTNEEELDQWLIDNGHYKESTDKETGERVRRPDKSKIGYGPHRIVGKYCALDTDATYLLMQKVFAPVLGKFRQLDHFHREWCMSSLEYLIREKKTGIPVSEIQFNKNIERLEWEGYELRQRLDEHPAAGPLIAGLLQTYADQYRTEKEPEKYKKMKVREEPKKYKKNGDISKNWASWKEWHDTVYLAGPELSKNWVAWEAHWKSITQGKHKKYRFSVGSPADLQWLLYGVCPSKKLEGLGHAGLLNWKQIRPHVSPRKRGRIEIQTEFGPVQVDMTESGGLPTDEKALLQAGDLGTLLLDMGAVDKELGYTKMYLDMVRDGRIHADYKNPGTITGRRAGAILVSPKSRSLLSAFAPRKGRKWIDFDLTALENVVLAELSQDPSLLELYGPDANPNQDAYLYNGSQLPVMGEEIRKYYDRKNPTAEMVAEAKRVCKKWRNVSKKTTLSKNYGIGWEKLWMDLMIQGIRLPQSQVKQIHSGFDSIYEEALVKWKAELVDEYNARGGWIMSGLGRPLAVSEDLKKDLISRNCQTTGHDIMIMWLVIVGRLLDKNIPNWSPVIMDYHDQLLVDVPEGEEELALKLIAEDSFRELNEVLNGTIPLKGDGGVVGSLADAKCE